jgi:hypothetical protein
VLCIVLSFSRYCITLGAVITKMLYIPQYHIKLLRHPERLGPKYVLTM